MRLHGIMLTGRARRPLRTGSGSRVRGRRAPLFVFMACAFGAALAAANASAMQVLDAVDHAELTAEVSATAVSRIALKDDRIARVIRAPGGFETEHDPGSGDLYLRPPVPGTAPGNGTAGGPGDEHGDAADPGAASVALFIGTEKGFTYRLTLTMADRGSAQILIRNAAATADRNTLQERKAAGDPRIGALVELVRAVARREPLAGFAIDAAGAGDNREGDNGGAARVIETWRGARFEALVVEIAAQTFADAAGLAARLGPGIAAAWLAGPGTGPHGGRIAVLVRETAGASR